MANNGECRTCNKHAGLMHFVSSGSYFARIKFKNNRNGRVKRVSRESDVFRTAKKSGQLCG